MRRSLWLVILSLPALALPAGAAGSGEIVKIKRHRPEAAGLAPPPLAWGVKAQRYPHPFKP